MKRVGFDLDGVLYPWHRSIHRYCLEIGLTKTRDCYEFWNGESKTISDEVWDILINYLPAYEDAIPDDYVLGFVNQYKNAEIYYITNRPIKAQRVTQRWLEKNNFPQIDNLIFVKGDKTPTLRKLGIDIYYDDRIEIAEEAAKYCEAYLVTAPHNVKQKPERSCRIPALYSYCTF